MKVPFLWGAGNKEIKWGKDNSFNFSCRLIPGLYTVGIQADMKKFKWESLALPMTKSGNKGQLTAPWDFDLHNDNTPLLPTWKIFRNERYVGIFYLQRPTVEDISNKTLRGEFGFQVEKEGEISIRAEPHNVFKLKPIAVYLEENAFDRMEPQLWTGKKLSANWAWHVANEIGWDSIRKKISGTDWCQFLDKAIEKYSKNKEKDKPIPDDGLGVCSFYYQLKKDEALKEDILNTVRHLLALPAWGNQNPYGYGHNGDMGCALTIKHASLVYNWMHDELGALRGPLLDRIERQMELFYEQQLLLAQYWGGACLQDHGYRSSPSIGFAAINMLGHSEIAEKILAFYVPRFFRTIEKQPVDGFIPFSQYHKIQLYCNDMTDFRIAFKFASGDDIFASATAYRNVPKYIMSCLDEESMLTMVCVTRGDRKDFEASLPYLMVLAKDFGCENSRYLANLLTRHYRRKSFTGLAPKVYEVLPMAILEDAEGIYSDKRPATLAMNVYEDGGAIQYRDEATRFNVAVMCQSNSSSFHSLGTDLSGTDMGISNPSMGAFTVGLKNEMLLQTAESGYRTGTQLGNVLLVDGKGQYGDIGYPMGIPMRTWRGHRIQRHHFDPSTRKGFARLNLPMAYPDDMQIMTYTRDFYFEPDHLRVRDTVISRSQHKFSYWFNTYSKHRIEQTDERSFCFSENGNSIDLIVGGVACVFRIEDTETIWGYGNEQGNETFKHLEVSLRDKTDAFTVEFKIKPKIT
jgi:hypothetical protein